MSANLAVKHDEQALVPVSQAAAVMSMLQSAVEKGASPESLAKLVDLQERIMAKQAEMDFNQAMHSFQVECPPISKNKKAGSGSFTYNYATLDHIASTIAPILQKNGLSYSFESTLTENSVEAVCNIKHVGGHSSSAKFSAPIDRNAKMNDMQKAASALSYARRYALILALGITTGEIDDDGHSVVIQYITESQAADLQALAEEVGADVPKFLAYLKVDAIERIPAKSFKECVRLLESKRKK